MVTKVPIGQYLNFICKNTSQLVFFPPKNYINLNFFSSSESGNYGPSMLQAINHLTFNPIIAIDKHITALIQAHAQKYGVNAAVVLNSSIYSDPAFITIL